MVTIIMGPKTYMNRILSYIEELKTYWANRPYRCPVCEKGTNTATLELLDKIISDIKRGILDKTDSK